MRPPPVPMLVHDYLLVLRGAERTFAAMADLWPDAPISTLLYDADGTRGRFAGHAVATSALQRLPVRQQGFRRLLPAFPVAARRLPTGRSPLIVSSSSAFAHAAPRPDDGVHLCYCHSPFRYIWFETERARAELPRALRPLFGAAIAALRSADRRAADRVTHLVANSEITRRRIADVWSRDAPVVHPPVDVDRFRVGEPEDYLLTVGELVRHKRTDFALRAARRAGRRVLVVGDGPERPRLAHEFAGTAEFLGRVGDDELRRLVAGALALLQPNVEEFGIAAVEAQAAGRPVVATAAGGALETVRDGVTGVLVPDGDADAYAEALRETDFTRFDSRAAVEHAQTFATPVFQDRLRRQVERAWSEGPR